MLIHADAELCNLFIPIMILHTLKNIDMTLYKSPLKS